MMGLRAVLLDIEGTTAPISFVYETLFPYARQHGPALIRELWNQPELEPARLGFDHDNVTDVVAGAPPVRRDDPETVIEYYLWLMDQDHKSPALKLIQGLVWQRGFRSGEILSRVFADVPLALDRWKRAGRQIAIYSSGSVLAQQMLFTHSEAGDLTAMIDAYFDTGVGPKRSVGSYQAIASALTITAGEILFASDVVEELDAAAAAGFQTVLVVRPGNATVNDPRSHSIIQSFDEIT